MPRAVAADPIVITSGTIAAGRPVSLASADVRVEGDTFSLAGRFTEGGALACFPCPAGSHPIALFWAGDMGSGSGTVNGTLYPSLFFGGTGFNVGGIATLPPDGPSMLSVTFPFSVAAGSTIWGFSDRERSNRVFALDVTGSGTAVMTVVRPPSGPVLYDTQALSFTFGASPAPTPEPGSLLLLGTGLVGVIVRRARRTLAR
jgi:hypothetical protein